MTAPPMWKAIYVSERGTSHVQDGTPCQDGCRVRVIGGSVLLTVCADGAGSASHARDGAQLACRKFIECVSGFLNPPPIAKAVAPLAEVEKSGVGFIQALWSLMLSASSRVTRRMASPRFPGEPEQENATALAGDDGAIPNPADPLGSIDRDTLVEWCVQVRESLAARASELGVPIRELACTLLGAVVSDSTAVFVQVGDGAMVVGDGECCDVVFWPQSGEYANTTNFLTDAAFKESLQFVVRQGRITEFAGFTDGLERLILRFDDRTVHRPALGPMFDQLRAAADEKALFAPLRGFLQSEPVNARTNDDKTLILAVRNERSGNGQQAPLPG